jgi:hypothetical protein
MLRVSERNTPLSGRRELDKRNSDETAAAALERALLETFSQDCFIHKLLNNYQLVHLKINA